MSRIFLVDDHPMLRAGLMHLIQSRTRWEVCGEVATAAEALNEVPRLSPDLVVADLTLPDKSGLELIKDLHALCPRLPVLVLSMHDEMLYAERVIRAGGKGYLTKGSPTDMLVDAITRVLSGEIYVSAPVSALLLKNLAGKRAPEMRSRLGCLTDRELEIFELVGRGRSASQISEQLHISPRTVDAHRSNIKAKLGLPDAPSLMRDAVLWVELGGRSAPANEDH